MRKRFLALVMGITVIATVFTGCGSTGSSDTSSSSATSSESSSSSDTEASVDANTVYGKVTSVSDGEVTYEVMTKDENAMPDGSAMPQGSGAPEQPDGSAMPQGSGAPDGNGGADGQAPEGSAMPQGSGAPDAKGGADAKGGDRGFTSTGETSTVTIGDDVTVQSAGMDGTTSDASVDDISEGTIIQLTYDGDTLSSVVIQSMGGGKMDQKSDDSQNSTDTSTDTTSAN